MIIEGFICPECQQDMSSVELLQAHFELVHLSNKNTSKRSSQQNSSNSNGTLSNETSGFSCKNTKKNFEFISFKTLIS